MNATLPAPLGLWWPILVGWGALYLPTYYDAAHGLWNQDDYAYSPIVLGVVLYLFWTHRRAFIPPAGAPQRPAPRSHPVLGWPLLVLGLACYALGRSQAIPWLELGSQLPVLLGTLLLTRGTRAVRVLWFPLFFLMLMVPWPNVLVDALTSPLKHMITATVDNLLHAVGYPTAHLGVTLSIGPYRMQVAEACSGLHSMVSLTAMGLLYLYLIRPPGWLRNLILIASIVPIAIGANILRVVALVLVTYHLGEEAGQGVVHDIAGILMFVMALLMLFSLDWLWGQFRQKPA